MRSSKSRSRSKSNRQRSLGNIVNRVFDSSGPEGKVRGTPQQIIEKYLALARDAQLSNDRVAEQAFFQHAEHYTRLLGEAMREQAERQQNHQNHQPQYGRGDDQQPRNGDDQPSRNGDDGRDFGTSSRDESPQPRPDMTADRSEQPELRQPEPRPVPQQIDAAPVEQPAADGAASEMQSPPQGRRNPRRPVSALPDAMATDAEGGEVRVETPEDKAAPRRARAPRNATGPVTRNRRKPAAEDGAAAPADSTDQA